MKTKNLALALLGCRGRRGAVPVALQRATAQNATMMAASDTQVWDAFGGNQQAQKYSTATQITPDNVEEPEKGVGHPHRRRFQRRA